MTEEKEKELAEALRKLWVAEFGADADYWATQAAAIIAEAIRQKDER